MCFQVFNINCKIMHKIEKHKTQTTTSYLNKHWYRFISKIIVNIVNKYVCLFSYVVKSVNTCIYALVWIPFCLFVLFCFCICLWFVLCLFVCFMISYLVYFCTWHFRTFSEKWKKLLIFLDVPLPMNWRKRLHSFQRWIKWRTLTTNMRKTTHRELGTRGYWGNWSFLTRVRWEKQFNKSLIILHLWWPSC